MIEGSTVAICYGNQSGHCIYASLFTFPIMQDINIQVIIMLTICFHIPDLHSCMPYVCVHNPIHTFLHG